jgi:hypothetical protein
MSAQGTWRQALMKFNEGKQFSIPKKGTKEYEKVRAIYDEMKEPKIDLSKPNKKKLKIAQKKPKLEIIPEEEEDLEPMKPTMTKKRAPKKKL